MISDILRQLYLKSIPKNFSKPSSVKEVIINKDYYLNDCKIYKHIGEEKDGLKFLFKSDFKLEDMPIIDDIPYVKSYKITCNYCEIKIYCETDTHTYYKIFDCCNNEVFDSYSKENFIFTAPKEGEYNFVLQPYKIKNGEYIYGDKIKLPSVLVEGKSNILDTDWWED